MPNPLIRGLLGLWNSRHITLLLAPTGTNDTSGNPLAAPVSADHPLPVVLVGGSSGTGAQMHMHIKVGEDWVPWDGYVRIGESPIPAPQPQPGVWFNTDTNTANDVPLWSISPVPNGITLESGATLVSEGNEASLMPRADQASFSSYDEYTIEGDTLYVATLATPLDITNDSIGFDPSGATPGQWFRTGIKIHTYPLWSLTPLPSGLIPTSAVVYHSGYGYTYSLTVKPSRAALDGNLQIAPDSGTAYFVGYDYPASLDITN